MGTISLPWKFVSRLLYQQHGSEQRLMRDLVRHACAVFPTLRPIGITCQQTLSSEVLQDDTTDPPWKMFHVVVTGCEAARPSLVIGEITTGVQRAYQSVLRILALMPDAVGDVRDYSSRLPITADAFYLHCQPPEGNICTACGKIR